MIRSSSGTTTVTIATHIDQSDAKTMKRTLANANTILIDDLVTVSWRALTEATSTVKPPDSDLLA